MPYVQVWRNPIVFMRWRGVTVYHAYEDDEYNAPESYSFTTNKEGSGAEGGDDPGYFHVPELPTWVQPEHPPYLSPKENDTPENRKAWDVFHAKTEPWAIRRAIRAAIDSGVLTQKGVEKVDAKVAVPM